MKKEEILSYDLADVGNETVAIEVHLYKKGPHSWSFVTHCDTNLDCADRILMHYADECFSEKTFDFCFDDICRRARPSMTVSPGHAFFAFGDHFPDRSSVVSMVEAVFLPCWMHAVNRVLAFRSPGDSWDDARRKAEKACFLLQKDKQAQFER